MYGMYLKLESGRVFKLSEKVLQKNTKFPRKRVIYLGIEEKQREHEVP